MESGSLLRKRPLESWSCNQCTFANHIDLRFCEICSNPKKLETGHEVTAEAEGAFAQFEEETVFSASGRLLRKKAANRNQVQSQINFSVDSGRMGITTSSSSSSGHYSLRDYNNKRIEPQEDFPIAMEGEVKTVGLIGDLLLKDKKLDFSLAFPHPQHITQKNTIGAEWSCGYRNIQMMTSSLLQVPLYGALLFVDNDNNDDHNNGPVIPDILTIQRHIELAWQGGWDPDGAAHFEGILREKASWIGATETAALFRSFGLRAMVVDFVCKEKKPSIAKKLKETAIVARVNELRDVLGGAMDEEQLRQLAVSELEIGEEEEQQEGEEEVNHDLYDMAARVVKFVSRYFDPKENGSGQFRFPLYLQHEGHSRSIVGVEWAANSHNGQNQTRLIESLLVFDPLSDSSTLRKHLLKGNRTWHRMVKKKPAQTIKRYCDYQIVYIAEGIMDWEERERSKLIEGTSDDTPFLTQL